MATLLKKGSRGTEVAELQKLLGITPADGIFGSVTENAVLTFQRQHSLTADGIVGNQTMTALLVARNLASRPSNKSVDPSVQYDPLKVHITKKPGRQIKYLAIHYTAGSRSISGAAQGVKSVFDKRQASADFVVDDSTMLQLNPDPHNYYCWAVGDARNPYSGGGQLFGKACNANTISIEVCSTLQKGTSSSAVNHTGWSFSPAALSNALRLAKILMRTYNIPLTNVVRHYDITGKPCPGIVGWNNAPLYDTNGNPTKQANNSSEWQRFVSLLRS